MENQNKKCASKEHKEIDAYFYCQECKIYMCNKCETFHSKLHPNHHTFNSDTNINEQKSFQRRRHHNSTKEARK